jgi:hypothetical protein
LAPDEIFEQVVRLASELALQDKQEAKDAAADDDNDDASDDNHLKRTGHQMRLSNIVFMGMGEEFCPINHNVLVMGGKNGFQLWNVQSGSVHKMIETSAPVTRVIWSPFRCATDICKNPGSSSWFSTREMIPIFSLDIKISKQDSSISCRERSASLLPNNDSFTGQPIHDTHASKVVSSIDAKTHFACVHQRVIGRFGIRHGGLCQPISNSESREVIY